MPDGEDAEELSFLEGSDEPVEKEAGEEEEEIGEEDEEEGDDDEEDYDEDEEEGDDDEEDYDEDEEEGDDDEEDYDEDEEDYDEDEEEGDDDEEGYDEDEEGDDEAEEEKKGFFSRIFGWGDDDSDEDEEEEEEEDEEDISDEDDEMENGENFDEEEGYDYDSSEDSFNTEEKGEEFSKSTPVSSEKPVGGSIDGVAKQPQISLKKIRRSTYRKGVYLVNAIYIARKGDTIESISQKIYNSDQKAALYIMNPHLRSRNVKVGDKIYYGSSRRPQDSSKILIYYEELGIPSKTYLISSGENIRSVSKNLLGHENSWKEIWATNPDIVSKGVVSAAVELKYWPNEVQPAAVAPPVEDSAYEEEEVSEDMEDTGEMEADDDILEEEKEAEADGDEEDSSDDEVLSAPVDVNRKKKMAEWVIIAGVFLLILLSLVTLVIKKRRGKREFDYTSTNIQPLS